jgi:outer membrane protein assembly factor BamD
VLFRSEKWYGDSDFADNNQFLRGEIRMTQRKDISAAREFQQVISNYPNTDLFDDVIAQQYAIGDKLYDQGQLRLNQWWRPFRQRPLRRAAEVYEMVVQNQPFTPEAAEAQYKIGLTQYTRENYYEAAYEYRRVIEDYGGSDWVDEAAHGLALCYYELSLPPDYDQSPSRLAIRAIDDFRARFPQDQRVPELEEIRTEMHESIAQQRLQTAQFYEKRRQFPAAKLYYQRVVDQFPGTEAATKAREWIEAHPGVDAPFARGIGRDRLP